MKIPESQTLHVMDEKTEAEIGLVTYAKSHIN